MQSLHHIARPGVMLSQVWPHSREVEGATIRAFEQALHLSYFTSFQSVEIPYRLERKDVAKLLQGSGCTYTYCITRILNENKLNLSDLDEGRRHQSCDRAIQALDEAREAGAHSVSVVSGPVPNQKKNRVDAIKALEESLVELSKAATEAPKLNIIIEPLDVDAHKKFTIGYTSEGLSLVKKLGSFGYSVSLCLDTAHMMLNGEDPIISIKEALEETAEFHYANVVTDKTHSHYGDYHIPFGKPGRIDTKDIAYFMMKQVEINFFNETNRPVIMCEVYNKQNKNHKELLKYNASILQNAWETACTNNKSYLKGQT